MSVTERDLSDADAQAEEAGHTLIDADAPAFTQAQIDAADHAIAHGHIDLGTLAGFEHEETEALYARALDDLRVGLVNNSIGRFLALIALHPKEAKFVRGLALCYQYMRLWGWAETVYMLALEHDPDDGIAMALLGEVSLYTDGKQEAHRRLSEVVARGVRRPAEAPYVQRAHAILAKIKL